MEKAKKYLHSEMERLVGMFPDACVYAMQTSSDTFYVKVMPAQLFNSTDEQYVEWECGLSKYMLKEFGLFTGFTSEGELFDFDIEQSELVSEGKAAQHTFEGIYAVFGTQKADYFPLQEIFADDWLVQPAVMPSDNKSTIYAMAA